MVDLRQYVKEKFYSGVPDEGGPDGLVWRCADYSLVVREVDGKVIATMTGGNCEWTTEIDPENFVEGVNAALEDASTLGRAANWSNDE